MHAKLGGNNSKEADACYRSGIKTALSIRQNTNNEIIFIESGKFPLNARIKKAQLKFWISVNKYIVEYPEAALSKIMKLGLESNVPFLKYYKTLESDFGTLLLARIV